MHLGPSASLLAHLQETIYSVIWSRQNKETKISGAIISQAQHATPRRHLTSIFKVEEKTQKTKCTEPHLCAWNKSWSRSSLERY